MNEILVRHPSGHFTLPFPLYVDLTPTLLSVRHSKRLLFADMQPGRVEELHGEFSYFPDDATSSSDALRAPSTTHLPISIQYAAATPSQQQHWWHTTTSSSLHLRFSPTLAATHSYHSPPCPQKQSIDVEMPALAICPGCNELASVN